MLAAGYQIHAEQQNHEKHQLAHRKPANRGVDCPENRDDGAQREQCQRQLHRRKMYGGPRAQKMDRVAGGGQGQERLCRGQRKQKRQNRQAEEDRSPAGISRSRKFCARRCEEIMKANHSGFKTLVNSGREFKLEGSNAAAFLRARSVSRASNTSSVGAVTTTLRLKAKACANWPWKKAAKARVLPQAGQAAR